MKHKCKQMKREEEFQSIIGQAAWLYYKNWMKVQQKLVPKSKSFLSSNFYNSFIKFSKHVRKVQLPDPNVFIRFMKDRGILPPIWTCDEVYSMYLEYLDRRAPATQRAATTTDMLLKIADLADVDVSEVFDVLEANDVIALLRRRSLSPWILLQSNKFRDFFANKTSSEERIILESLIRPDFWTDKFAKNPKSVQLMKVIVEELKL